ncbi:hypothetical protein BJ912DRAFT_1064303 [Pholiota molesta]|nr:hypothetical protein BJ912DRAFT_1064303 [Pholiota molesta]
MDFGDSRYTCWYLRPDPEISISASNDFMFDFHLVCSPTWTRPAHSHLAPRPRAMTPPRPRRHNAETKEVVDRARGDPGAGDPQASMHADVVLRPAQPAPTLCAPGPTGVPRHPPATSSRHDDQPCRWSVLVTGGGDALLVAVVRVIPKWKYQK